MITTNTAEKVATHIEDALLSLGRAMQCLEEDGNRYNERSRMEGGMQMPSRFSGYGNEMPQQPRMQDWGDMEHMINERRRMR